MAAKLRLAADAFDLLVLAGLIFADIGTAREVVVENELTTIAAEARYSEEQIADLRQQVFEAYQRDGGKKLLESALIRLRKGARVDVIP